jgi:hypothetical protein
MTEFKVNDIVEAFGLRGRVVKVHTDLTYPVEVEFEGDLFTYFTLDGKMHPNHKLSTLKLISRAKRKVKKEVKGWANVYYGNERRPVSLYLTKEDALVCASHNAIAVAVECTGFYDVEVDE